MKPIAVVDVDNTLYDFSIPWYLEICKTHPQFPDPHRWSQWDLADLTGVSKKELYAAIGRVHERQEEFYPYSETTTMLSYLSKKYHVIIATHRALTHKEVLVRWLNKYHLYHDEVFVSFDKSIIFGKASLLIDDSPECHAKAAEYDNLKVIGLEFPWNKNMYSHHASIFCLFNSPYAMLSWIVKDTKEV